MQGAGCWVREGGGGVVVFEAVVSSAEGDEVGVGGGAVGVGGDVVEIAGGGWAGAAGESAVLVAGVDVAGQVSWWGVGGGADV